ncbi:MAG TPA: GyrI-like domain-containing protein [Cryobacterium sp.]|nr:GyrI-like domain-containing protein [Cryobacterium sp.]
MKAQRIELEPRTLVGVHETPRMDELTEFMGRALGTAATAIDKQGAHPAGPPISMYHGSPTDIVDITAGFPVAQPVTPTPGVVIETLPGGPAIEAIHTGPYDTLTETYAELTTWVAEQKLNLSPDMWEEYVVGPDTEPDPAKWQTRIVFPLS